MAAERVILIGVGDRRTVRGSLVRSLEELASLAWTAGAEVIESFLQMIPRYNPALLLGTGKIRELAQIAHAQRVDLLIFDTELSAAQIRNIETTAGIRAVDRTTLILDIFAKHARTREARLQVELAQLEYRYPRLVGTRTELSRLGGGIGTRGPGERKLEIDRRRIKDRISTLKQALKKIERSKEVQRKGRTALHRIAVVGYTNAGKSSLVNTLAKTRLLTADYLFSTLDSNTSVLFIPPRHKLLISDTVGFLRNLPHGLIASFRATLAEVIDAELLIHIVDATAEELDRQIETVEDVLAEIGAHDKTRVVVFNKTDRLFKEEEIRLRDRFPAALFVSARYGTGISDLKNYLKDYFYPEPDPDVNS